MGLFGLSLPDILRTFTKHKEVTGTTVGNKRAMDVFMRGPLSAFGELETVQLQPTVQIDALQGILEDVHETLTGPSGSVTIKDDHGGKEFHCQSGTSVGGYGILRSQSVVRYRPGQGSRLRFTARYGAPVNLSTQRAGAVNAGTELSFGYNGTSFGILYRTAGRLEIQTLSITTPASGNETLTLTLDGNEYTISLTSGTAAHNAFEIVEDNSFSATHNAYQNGSTVIFTSKAVGDETGSYTFSSDGAAVGSFVETGAGKAVNDTFINQADWNITPLTSESDPFILDPSKGNVFQITYQYLGYGDITFWVEDPATGQFIPVHEIGYANNNVVPSLDTPVFKIGWFAASLGATTNTEIFGASAMGAIDGTLNFLKRPVGHANTKTNVGTTLTNILSIRNRPTINGYINSDPVRLASVSVAVDGTKTATAEIHINPTVAGEPNWTYHDSTQSIVEYDLAGTTISSGTELFDFSLGKTDSFTVNLLPYNLYLNRTDVVSIGVKTSSGTTEATASITWVED